MGLDQYAFRVTGEGEKIELAYWRKHNRLQGWMENLYIQKGGTEEFNCIDIELGVEDIIQLEQDIDTRSLPVTDGFFFGTDSYRYTFDKGTYEDLQQDLNFCRLAKRALDANDKVIYTSWW